jgi:hypothetical protein
MLKSTIEWNSRHLRCGSRSREGRTGVLLPTHSLKDANGWGTSDEPGGDPDETSESSKGEEPGRGPGGPRSHFMSIFVAFSARLKSCLVTKRI